jgi:hypothetical protein
MNVAFFLDVKRVIVNGGSTEIVPNTKVHEWIHAWTVLAQLAYLSRRFFLCKKKGNSLVHPSED